MHGIKLEYQQTLLFMLLMVMALIDTEGSDEPPQRISLFISPEMKRLGYMTSSRHLPDVFFQILDLSEEFLKVDPSERKLQESYLKDQKVATSVNVENYLAE